MRVIEMHVCQIFTTMRNMINGMCRGLWGQNDGFELKLTASTRSYILDYESVELGKRHL
jgi:hypothetical protein